MSTALGALLGPLIGVTISAADLAAVEHCYGRFLGYRVAGRGTVPDALAGLWGTPGVAGARYLLMAPRQHNDFVFRFIETPACAEFVPFTSHGWNAAELIVQRVDELAETLADSPFQIVGPPADLSFSEDIRAMQVRGPADEILYLTEIKRPVPGLDTPTPRCPVDRAFIVILGGESLSDLQKFYRDEFQIPIEPAMESRVTFMSAAFGLSKDHRFPIAALALRGQSFIEADEMPAAALPREAPGGLLPPGISMVSFAGVAASGERALTLPELPYRGRCQAACRRGPAGELIEVIHSG